MFLPARVDVFRGGGREHGWKRMRLPIRFADWHSLDTVYCVNRIGLP
jgi:hypothetical protein